MNHAETTLALVGVTVASMLLCTTAEAQDSTQLGPVVAHASILSEEEASIELQLSGGGVVSVTFADGSITVQRGSPGSIRSEVVAQYDMGGRLETAWRDLVERARRADPAEMLTKLQDWSVDGLDDVESAALHNARAPFARLAPVSSSRPVAATQDEPPSHSAAVDAETDLTEVVEALDGLDGLAALRALQILKEIEAVEGANLSPQAERLEQLRASEALRSLEQLRQQQRPHSRVPGVGAAAAQVASDVLGLMACFIALAALGFGLAFFAPRPLEVVADTVHQSFWRSFTVGVLAQPLVLPVFGMLLLGLALTVVGILLIPFAIVGFAVAAVMAILGGYIAVARSIGEAYLRRRMSLGQPVGGWLAYRYVIYGLAAVIAVWVPAVLLGWVPLARTIATVSAVFITWMLATAGFGAAILSRAGIRGTFARRFDHALTDEYLYHTPKATPVVRSRQPGAHAR